MKKLFKNVIYDIAQIVGNKTIMVNLISWPSTHAVRQIVSRDGSFSHFRNRSSRQGSNGRSVVDVNRSSGEREASASRFVVFDRLIYHSIGLTHFYSVFLSPIATSF